MNLRWIVLSMTLFALTVPAAGDDRVRWLEKNAHAIRSIDPADDDFADLEPLRKALEGARIVQLGEQTHGDGATFHAKTRLIKFLHQELGFDVLAFESGLFDCHKSWESFRDGKNALQSARLGVFGIWTLSAQVHPLIDYIGESARGRSPLEVCGFDCRFSAGGSRFLLTDLEVFLKSAKDKLFSGAEWKAIAEAIGWLQDSEYEPTKKEQKRGEAALDMLREVLAHPGSKKLGRDIELWRQVSRSILAEARQRWKYQNVQSSKPEHVNERDAQMAENLIWLAENRFPDRKIIVWAATFHILRQAGGIQGGLDYGRTVVMGETVAKHFGDDVYSIGFAAYEGTAGTAVKQSSWRIDPAPKGSIEALLVDAGFDNAFFSLRDLDRKGAWLKKKNTLGVLGYRPLRADWTRSIDGVVFTRKMFPSTRPGSAPPPPVPDFLGTLTKRWQSIQGMVRNNAQYADKNGFIDIYRGWKTSAGPKPKDIARKMGEIEKWLESHRRDPHCVWRGERLLAAMAQDAEKARLALKHMENSLKAYPEKKTARPHAESVFQHLANEQAFILWDAKNFKTASRAVVNLMQNDRRFRYFYFEPWQQRLAEEGPKNGLAELRKAVKSAYARRQKKFPEFAEEARRFAGEIP